MEHQKTRIWVLVEDISEVDFKKKEYYYCANSFIMAHLANTRDPEIREVSLMDGQRGITLGYNLANDKIIPFLGRYGLSNNTQWWRHPNESHQFQHEINEFNRKHNIGQERPLNVYFILNPTRNSIKIGTSRDTDARFRQLQTASADPLVCLGVMPGTRVDERNLHAQFASCQMAGEWFDYSEEVQEAIENLLNQ